MRLRKAVKMEEELEVSVYFVLDLYSQNLSLNNERQQFTEHHQAKDFIWCQIGIFVAYLCYWLINMSFVICICDMSPEPVEYGSGNDPVM